MNVNEDTIVAISTPVGTGGIAVIRVSGQEALEKTAVLFEGRIDKKKIKSHTAHVGYFLEKDTKKRIDQVVLTVFRKPNSFTGEDVVEISCHGGAYVSGLILQNLLSLNLRLAEPGEFTKRAFLNGKMDLAQAEAVADLIHAKTRISLGSAINQLEGEYSKKIHRIREKILDIMVNLEIELDFSEEDIILKPPKESLQEIEQALMELDNLIKTYQKGKLIREGVMVGLAGKANVGKSSLFNAILGYERAIVDELPGTTRDAIEAQLDIDGIFYRLIDTAGFRESNERIEQKGIGITETILKKVDLILLLFDASTGITEDDHKIYKRIEEIINRKTEDFKPEIFIVWNKMDLICRQTRKKKKNNSESYLSAKTGAGLDLLHQKLSGFLRNKRENEVNSDQIITNIRHYTLLQKAKEYLLRSKESLLSNMSNEFIALDMREALDAIGEIIGKTSTEDILNRIFANFCIGK